MEPESAEPSPLLPLSSELLDPELEPLEPELPFEPESSELAEVGVVPVVPEPECRADTTATDSPVPPMPSTAVAIAAAEARRIQRRRGEWNASGVTMTVSLAGGSSAALQENVK
ncbi:MAG TPA: hypothetical protein VFI00_06620 [Kribbella sp.]|nr:hypothetical protein [Kribbella sp.]